MPIDTRNPHTEPQPNAPTLTALKTAHDWRRELLAAMKPDVEGRLWEKLHDSAAIALPTETPAEPVGQSAIARLHPQRILQVFGSPTTELDEGQSLVEVFQQDDIDGRLLILGAPGSGKTTLLLELAGDLIPEAQQDPTLPIPVIFELSALKEDRHSFVDWMATRLQDTYNVPVPITRQWIEKGELLPLLDDLDELRFSRQTKCIEKINEFLQIEAPHSQIVICCRDEQYQQSSVILRKLRGAVWLQPAIDTQIEQYLKQVDRDLLWEAIKDDSEGFLALARMPFFLQLMAIAYPQGLVIQEQHFNSEYERRKYRETCRKTLFDAYIQQRLEQPHDNQGYEPKDTKHWLVWLAQRLRDQKQTEFMSERMQPSWLSSHPERFQYKLIVGITVGFIVGLSIGLIWSWIAGIAIGAIVGAIVGFKGIKIKRPLKPNPGLLETAKNVAIVSIISYPLAVLLWLLPRLGTGPSVDWNSAIAAGLPIALIFAIAFSGWPAIAHYILRFVLWKNGRIPWRCDRFLNYAAERGLIQQVRGHYRFIHHLLREHFAGVPPYKCVQTLTEHTDTVWSLVIRPDGEAIASASSDATIKLWTLSPEGQASLLRTLTGHSAAVVCVAFTPDGNRIVSGSNDKTIRIWNLETVTCERILTEHSYTISSIAISPDGQTIASGCGDGTLRLWNLETGELLGTLDAHIGLVRCIAFTPDSHKLVTGGYDKTIKLWNVETGMPIRTFTGGLLTKLVRQVRRKFSPYVMKVHSVAISPDGETLVSNSGGEAIEVWNLNTGKLLRTLPVHSGVEWSVAMRPDWQMLAARGTEGIIRLCHFPSGHLICTLTDHAEFVNSVALSSDLQTIVSGGDDTTIKIWRLCSP